MTNKHPMLPTRLLGTALISNSSHALEMIVCICDLQQVRTELIK